MTYVRLRGVLLTLTVMLIWTCLITCVLWTWYIWLRITPARVRNLNCITICRFYNLCSQNIEHHHSKVDRW